MTNINKNTDLGYTVFRFSENDIDVNIFFRILRKYFL